MRNLFSIGKWLIMVWLLALNPSMAQTVKLEQGQNGGIDNDPVSPVNWATGNSNSSNSHFFEGQSIPYRMTISKLRAGNHTVEIEWDTRTNNKSAIDYITSFKRICEDVIPSELSPTFKLIPPPSGIPQPSTSFNLLTDAEKMIAIYGGTLGEIKYVRQDNTSATSAVTRLSISFTAGGSNGPNNTVVIAWGGHIASVQDWGEGNSASNINGSPYHTRIISMDGKSVGGQDRSVQAASEVIDFDLECKIKGDKEVCEGSTASYSVPAGSSGYKWTVTGGGEIISGQNTNAISVKWASSGKVSVDIDNLGACFPTQCFKEVTLITPPTLSVLDAVLCSTENGGNTAIANLFDFIDVSPSGDLSFKLNGSLIATPESIQVTDGDVVEVTAVGGCGSSESFKITVNDRQIFGICSQGKVYEPIGSELTALYEIFKQGQTVESNEVFYISGEEVLIEVIYFKDRFAEAKIILEELGFVTPTEEEIKQDPNSLIIAGFFPIDMLPNLNLYPEVINLVSPAIPGVPNKGATTTQGDRVMRSNLVRAGYVHFDGDQAIDGTGIKIGVLSDSYATRTDAGVNTLANDIGNGDLPANLYFYRDLPSRFGIGTDEGRAMLQIVHDVAPGAQLGFRTGVVTSGDFAQGIRDLAAAGSDVIVDDITYITEPFFRDGKVARAVNEVAANGVSYFTSAGNFGIKSFEGVFNPVIDSSIKLPLNDGEWTANGGGRVHKFSNGKTTQTINVFPGQNGPAVYMIALQWDDPLYSVDQTGSLYDLDIYLKDFGVPLFGFNRNNANGDPIEILSFTISQQTTIDLLISRECESCSDLDTNTGIKFKYVVFRGELDPNDPNGINASTIVGHANAEGAMTVGAVLYANTSVFGFDPTLVPNGTEPFTVATFSSRGGTLTNNEDRNKPDFSAPNGVNTTVNLGAPDLEGDGFFNFFGTSAAAPHAAAIAGLIKQARLKYYPTTKPTGWVGDVGTSLPINIRRLLKNTAQDMHEPGDDIKSGSGLVRADRALLSLATPNPDNIELVYDEGINPGEVEFKLKIAGTNLYEGSNVYLRDELLNATYGIDEFGFGYLEATIPPFVGNPGVTVVNNAISETEKDGGSAGPVYFFDIVKKTIAIRADDMTKKYAQILEPFSAGVYERVNNNWVPSELTLEDVGLTLNPIVEDSNLWPLTLSSPISGDLSDVGTYIITASHPQTGFEFTDFYNYVGVLQEDGNIFYDGTNNALGNYGPGIISVETLPITIKPIDLVDESSLEYGESISDAIKYEVIITPEDAARILDLEGLKADILNEYLLDLEKAKQEGDNSLPLGLFDTNARMLMESELVNLSFMVSGKSLINSRTDIKGRTLINGKSIVNGKAIVNSVIDVPFGSFLNYLNNPDDQNLLNAVINGKSLINSSTLLKGRSLINGKSMINNRALINARTGISGKTIINGKSIVNSESNEEDIEELDNVLFIFRESDLAEAAEVEVNNIKYYDFGASEDEDAEANLEFFSITLVSSIGVGDNFIVPGTFESRNHDVSYLPAKLEITPAKLTMTTSAEPSEIEFGDEAPIYSSEFDGFAYSSTFLDSNGNEVKDIENKESVVKEIEYSLLRDDVAYPSTGTIQIGTYSIHPAVTLFTPANYTVDLDNSTFGNLTVTGCINQAPKIGEFETAMGAGNTSNPATIKKPTGTKEGDLLVVGLMIEKGQAPSITPPDASWKEIRRTNQSNQVAMATYYKVVGEEEEPDTYGFRINQSPKWTMGITRVSGADIHHPDGPIVTSSGASGTQSFVAKAPSITIEECNNLVMLFYTNKKNATWTPPAGSIEVYDDPNNQQGLTSNMMAYFIQKEAGATGEKISIASLSEHWVAQAIAVRPLQNISKSARTLDAPNKKAMDVTISEAPSTLEVDEISGKINAYPNPVTSLLNINLKGYVDEEPTDNSLVILDAMGRAHAIQRTWFGDESRLELDFSRMHKGFYIINIRTIHGIKSIRVMKQSQ